MTPRNTGLLTRHEAATTPMPTDAEMSDWLDDMIYSGDLEGF